MRVFVSGATGYVGGYLVPALLEQGHSVQALVRPGSESRLPAPGPGSVTPVFGDALNEEQVARGMEGCEAAIHLVGIIREVPSRGITFERLHVRATEYVIRAAAQQQVARYVHMSALGANPDSPAGYLATKARAEQLVRASDLEYTLFRPSIIFGPGDDFINYFAGIMRRFHLIPIIGAGRYRMQPVYVDDVCQAFVRALDAPETVGNTIEIGGPDRYSYRDLMQVVKQVLGIRALPVYNPRILMQGLAKVFGRFGFFPVTEDQIIMLYDENITDDTRAFDLLDIEPTPFREGLQHYLSA